MTKKTFAAHLGRIAGFSVALACQIDWAEVGQIVFHGLIACAVAVYVAGELTGRWLHRFNDQLAHVLVGTAKQPIPAHPVATPVAHPLAELAAELEQLTVKQLRAMVGTKQRLPKPQLIAMALAA
jgi:hypothetical protein